MNISSNISNLLKIPLTNFYIPEKKIPDILLNDAKNFYKIHSELTAEQLTDKFLEKWAGYRNDYERGFVVGVFNKVIGEINNVR